MTAQDVIRDAGLILAAGLIAAPVAALLRVPIMIILLGFGIALGPTGVGLIENPCACAGWAGGPGRVQNGYVSSGTSGHERPLRELKTPQFAANTCPRVPARGRASLTRPSLVMKGSAVRVRASAPLSIRLCVIGRMVERLVSSPCVK